MNVCASTLSRADLDAVAALEQRVLATDGGHLKLDWGTLRSRSGDRPQDVLAHQEGRLVGFLGTYVFGSGPVELSGMVDPAVRRRGASARLLEVALGLFDGPALLVVPRTSAGGRALALGRGGTVHHSEHSLELSGRPAPGPVEPALLVRPAAEPDVPVVAALLAAGFGGPAGPLAPQVRRSLDRTLVATLDGTPVGSVRVEREGAAGGVYGLVVDPRVQGRGVGRDLLRRVCHLLLDGGATSVSLQVSVDNDRALGLYTSLGFTEVSTEDYYALPR